MRTRKTECGSAGAAGVECLEARRLLCGDGLDPAVAHGDSATRPPLAAADDAPGLPDGNQAEGHVIAAVAQSAGGLRGGRVVWGETAVVDGARVSTWAVVSRQDGSVRAVGASVPVSLAETMPARGSGPAGAFVTLDFPDVVRDTTYFNHLQIQPEPTGHVAPPGSVNPNRNAVAHFDYHFYGIPEAEVRAIPLLRPPPALPAVPADRLPEGYTQPGFSQAQMGRHSGPQWAITDFGPLSTIVLAGYTPDGSRMHFIEPMISRDTLLQQTDLDLNVPMPRTFDRDTLYSTRSGAVFHGGAHHFVYGDFIDTNPSTPANPSGGPVATGDDAGASAAPAAGVAVSIVGAEEDDDGDAGGVLAAVAP